MPVKTLDTDILRSAAGRAVSALKLLANEDRLLLLCQLSQ
jgi:ArsR family transcriptional regulator